MESKTKRILDISDLIQKKSLFLFGPRQTGKSTLVNQTSDGTFALQWNLLKGKLRLQIQTNPSYLTEQVEILDLHDCAIFIDEIQHIKKFEEAIASVRISYNCSLFITRVFLYKSFVIILNSLFKLTNFICNFEFSDFAFS